MPSVSQQTVNAGQDFTITDTFEHPIPQNAKVTLRFKARLQTDTFVAGSYVFLQVFMNDDPLTEDHLRQKDPCYHYPLCEWNRPACQEICHAWMYNDFVSDLECEGEHFVSSEPLQNILALQISPNFENHLLRDNPNHDGEDDNGFFVDPEVSGDPYQFEFDISPLVRGTRGQFNLTFTNPMTDYAAYMRCVVRRDYDYWGPDSIQFARVVLGDIHLVIEIPETAN